MTAIDELAAAQRARRNGNGELPLTDYGNCERLVREHGRDLRFAAGQGWLHWDGRRWRHDTDGEVMRSAKRVARGLLVEAASADDPKEAAAWALRSESEPRLRAMIALAQSERAVAVSADELDADPHLLCCENGTVDLRTGELRDHRRGDLITRMAPAAYHPGARSDTWQRVVEHATGGDRDLQAFLRRLAGYSATGLTSEEVLAFVCGPGATGKTTVVEAIKAALGDYATTADFETFLAQRNPGVRSDLARLAGRRLVVSAEVSEGRRLAEGLVKLLTGGDRVVARHLYQSEFEFTPRFTLWLVANDRPRARAEDDALWRRILVVPFTAVVPADKRDPEVKRRLREDPAERAAVLAWIVAGATEWYATGLRVPDAVRSATGHYRQENDALGDFLAAECRLTPEATVSAQALRARYEAWCGANGEQPLHTTRWGDALKSRGCERVYVQRARHWKGIELR